MDPTQFFQTFVELVFTILEEISSPATTFWLFLGILLSSSCLVVFFSFLMQGRNNWRNSFLYFSLKTPYTTAFTPQIREQMSVPDLYVVTVAFSALKKTGNFFFQNFFWKILTLFYATFQCGRYNVKKIQKKFFFAHEKLKKPPKKVAQNQPRPLFPTNQLLAAEKKHWKRGSCDVTKVLFISSQL